MPEYTVRKIKRFRGRQGQGYNLELCRDGAPVALVLNEANGGSFRFEWNMAYGRGPFEFVKEDDTKVILQIPVEEALLRTQIAGKVWTIDGDDYAVTLDMFVEDLIVQHDRTLAIKRRCVKSTCFRLKHQPPGEYMAVNVLFSSELGDKLRKQYGTALEVIYNEKLKEV